MTAAFDPPQVERYDRFNVVRDDRYPGGTKQVILSRWLPELGERHFVYAASGFGKGGAALAFACAGLGYRATLFLPHSTQEIPWLEAVEKTGATIIRTPLMPLEKLDRMARAYAREHGARCLVPGFSAPRFCDLLIAYARLLPVEPQEIWCPVVSGTLAMTLEEAFPDAEIKPVSVVRNPDYMGRGTLLFAQEKFNRRVAVPPPYPSWPYSDAKIWLPAKKSGSDNAFIWNSNS